MNAYDFDKTVFYPDSSVCFVLFCLRHYPRAVLKALPKSLIPVLQFASGKADATRLKEKLFSFLPWLPDVEGTVNAFWDQHRDHIQSWYLEQKEQDDVLISASPTFLLEPIAAELGVSLIATRMDIYTGRIQGLNCHDQEKVRRFREVYPDAHIDRFYSDSLSDAPMAGLAEKAFLVSQDSITPWP